MQFSVLIELHEKCMTSIFLIYENCMSSLFGQPENASLYTHLIQITNRLINRSNKHYKQITFRLYTDTTNK